MSSALRGHWPALCCVLVLSACGGGGGGSTPQPPAPPPSSDTTPPDTTLSATPAALSNSANGTFTVSSTEAGGGFEASVDGAAYTAVASTFTLNNLADGAHGLNVRARDAAGNVDATPANFGWTIDTQAPETTIANAPATSTNSTTASFTFASEANATFQVSTNGGAYAAASNPYQLNGIANGAHTLSVRAVDPVGNVDATPATFSWQVDTSQPLAQIQFPTPVSYTDASQLHVRGTASDSHSIVSVTVNGVAATSTDAFAHWSALVPIAAGTNNLVVSVSDSFGNTNATAAAAQVANRGLNLRTVGSTFWDAAHGRLLTADYERDAIVALRDTDGLATIFSDATHGTGPAAGGLGILALDTANNRLIASDTDGLLSVNLSTGNRTSIPTAPATPETSPNVARTCNNPCTRIYATAWAPISSEPSVFSIDLATGARAVISGGDSHLGLGPSLLSVTGIAFDTSQGAPRLLITDSYFQAVFAVDPVTGNRSVLSSTQAPIAAGIGPAMQSPNGIELDTANNRALVTDNVPGAANRLFAINLTNGNRTLLPLIGASANYQSAYSPTLDAANHRLFIAAYPRANVVQVNLATNELARFADSNVGTGPMIAGGSILLDGSGSTPSLLTAARGGVVRVNLATGIRSTVVTTNFPSGGPAFIPQLLQFDTRPGVPTNRVFYSDLGGPNETLYSSDLTTGASTMLSTTSIPYSPHPEHPLDAANGRLLVSMEPTFGRSQLVPINVATGVTGPAIADSTVGMPSFGALNAMALDYPTGIPARLIAMDNQTIMYAIDLATGNRAIVSSNAGVGSGLSLAFADSIAINPATRRALVVSSHHHSILEVDLGTGNRSLVSGHNTDDQTIRGTGPWITEYYPRVAADFSARVAYVTSNEDSILTVDLVSGDRVLTAR